MLQTENRDMRIFTIRELSEQLRVSPNTIRRAVATRGLPAFRLSGQGKLLFEEGAITRWIKRRQGKHESSNKSA